MVNVLWQMLITGKAVGSIELPMGLRLESQASREIPDPRGQQHATDETDSQKGEANRGW